VNQAGALIFQRLIHTNANAHQFFLGNRRLPATSLRMQMIGLNNVGVTDYVIYS
jgi:hypothetical protein